VIYFRFVTVSDMVIYRQIVTARPSSAISINCQAVHDFVTDLLTVRIFVYLETHLIADLGQYTYNLIGLMHWYQCVSNAGARSLLIFWQIHLMHYSA